MLHLFVYTSCLSNRNQYRTWQMSFLILRLIGVLKNLLESPSVHALQSRPYDPCYLNRNLLINSILFPRTSFLSLLHHHQSPRLTFFSKKVHPLFSSCVHVVEPSRASELIDLRVPFYLCSPPARAPRSLRKLAQNAGWVYMLNDVE